MTTTTSAIELEVAADLSLPLGLVVQKLAILARSGAGKTNTAVVIVEELLGAGQQVVILDPPGAWWGLRSSADGKSAGFPVAVLGGPHADVPLDAGSGAVVADLVVDERLRAVVDLSDFTDGEIARFVAAFAQRLYARKNTERTPMLLVLEEADELAPQNLPASTREKGETSQAMMLHHVERIAKRGRMKGIGLLAISQRSASLNKHVLSQIEVLIAMQTTAPQDIAAIDEWIRHHGDQERRQQLLAEIAGLPIGTGFVWSPAWLRIFQKATFRRRRTFDSSATPEPGVDVVLPRKLADVNLPALRDKLAVAIADAAANDPAVLRQEIAALQQQLARSATAPGRKLELKEAELETARWEIAELRAQQQVRVEIVPTEHLQWLTEARRRLESAAIDLTNQATDLAGIIRAAEQRNAAAPEPVAMVPFEGHGPIHAQTGNGAPPAAVDAERDPVLRIPESNGLDLSGPQQRVLDVLKTLHHLGLKAAARIQVAAFSGYADPTTRRFREGVTALEREGLISFPSGGMLALTERGHKNALATAPITKLEDLHQAWYDRLKGPRDRILAILVELYPNEITREALAERAGYSDATTRRFREAVTSLESLGLAWYPYGGTVAATDVLFPPELMHQPLVGKAAVVFPKRQPGARTRR